LKDTTKRIKMMISLRPIRRCAQVCEHDV
jgi:hypothetical protein